MYNSLKQGVYMSEKTVEDVALLANPVSLVGNNQVLHLSQQQTASVNPVVYLFRQVEQVC